MDENIKMFNGERTNKILSVVTKSYRFYNISNFRSTTVIFKSRDYTEGKWMPDLLD